MIEEYTVDELRYQVIDKLQKDYLELTWEIKKVESVKPRALRSEQEETELAKLKGEKVLVYRQLKDLQGE